LALPFNEKWQHLHPDGVENQDVALVFLFFFPRFPAVSSEPQSSTKAIDRGFLMHCIISGCDNHADNNFGIRLRRADTSAIWAPNSSAYICDLHAVQGLKITVVVEANPTGKIQTKIGGVGTALVSRTTKITNAA
jgi:hypothetical protein